jgi:glycosyltransferase involved in cell wall biosynthesis
MPRPLFSIITPVYNGAAVLEKTLASVLSQRGDLLECLVIDGGSTDGTVEILQAQGDQVRWVSERDSGVYDAMNKGLALANGEFIYFLGAGDTLKPNILETVAERIPRDSMTFFYGNVYAEGYHRIYNGRYGKWKLSRINICHQAVFCHRHLFDVLGNFDTRYAIMADHVWNMKCFGDPSIHRVYSDMVIANFAAGGMSQQRPDARLVEDRLSLIQRHLGPVPYALNSFAALLPHSLKEFRYQAFQKLKARLKELTHASRH